MNGDATAVGLGAAVGAAQGRSPSRRLTAFFDDRAAAQKAVDDLVAIGIPNDRIRLTEGRGTTAITEETSATPHKGFWEELKDLFLPDTDRHGYAEGLSRGGFLLSAQVDDASYDRALDILDSEGAVDMDAREADWRAQGWTGTDRAAADALATPGAMGESSLIGQRQDDHGRARLRSYAVENDLTTGFPGTESAAGSFEAGRDRNRIAPHMEVIASDGTSIGTVDHLDGPDRIKLAKSTSPDGQHHYVPLTWVDHVDAHVHLNRSLADIKAQQSA